MNKVTPGTGIPLNDEGHPASLRIVATYRPKRTDDLRKCEMSDKIGRETEWRLIGVGLDDQPHPGQAMWFPNDQSWGGYWVWDEDLENARAVPYQQSAEVKAALDSMKVILPTFEEAEAAVASGKYTSLHRFILDHEPAGFAHERAFRGQLRDVILEVMNAKR